MFYQLDLLIPFFKYFNIAYSNYLCNALLTIRFLLITYITLIFSLLRFCYFLALAPAILFKVYKFPSPPRSDSYLCCKAAALLNYSVHYKKAKLMV